MKRFTYRHITNNMSIKTKFMVLAMLLIALTTVVVALTRANQIHRQTSALISERLQNNASMAVGIFGTVKIYTEWILNTIAAMPYVQEALTTNAHDHENLERTLATFFRNMNQKRDGIHAYANIFVFDAALQLIAAADPEGDTVSLFYWAFSHNILMAVAGQSFVSAVVENPQSGLWQFLFTEPVMINGVFTGMVAILSNTEVLDFFLREPTRNYDSFINIADSTGRIFFSNRPAYVGHHITDLGIVAALGYTPLNRIFNHNSLITGIDKIAYITVEPMLGWTVVSFFDADAVENIAWAIFLSLLPTVSGVIMAAILMIFIIQRSLTPLNALAATAKDVANGNLEVTFEARRNDEISQVSQSFLEIVTALKILQENFRKAETAMTCRDAVYTLEDSRLGGVFDEMLARTNNVIKHIQRSKMEAESASKAKSDFLSKMSHEIRTPMNAILGMAELILREDITDAAREQAITIKQSGDHLLSIINDILDLSKVESGKLEIINAEYLFHSTIHDVISIIKMRMTNSELRFAAYMQHDIPNELFGDEVRVRQILLNILTNAFKYTKRGHFSLDITGQKTGADTIMLTIKIKDTGIGIKEENMKKLFGEFNQFDQEKNRNIEGTGLGLAITHNLLKLMGGAITVSSIYGEGSEFTIHLPQKLHKKYAETGNGFYSPQFKEKSVLLYGRTSIYTEYAARALKDLQVRYRLIKDDSELHNKLLEEHWDYVFAEEGLAATAMHIAYTRELDTKVVLMSDTYVAKGGQDFLILTMPAYFLSIVNILGGRDISHLATTQHIEHFIAPDAKVLLVDDINTNLKVGKGLLKQYEVHVDLCTGGKEAIEAVVSGDYDLVLMDHMMPGINGVDATRHIRGFAAAGMGEKYAKVPIIALTANAIVGVKEMFLQNGFNDFLSKPIETAKLNSILVKWIPKEKQKHIAPDGTPEEEASATIEIENVDTARGISLSGGTISYYIDTLKVFHEDAIKKAEELTNCLNSNNMSLYTIYIHALKSACSNVGAVKFSEEAQLLEAAGVKQDRNFIAKQHDSFINSLKKLLADIGKAIADHTEDLDSETLDNNVLNDELARLKTALENYDIAAIDEISLGLRNFVQLPGTGAMISDILQNVFVGKYKPAAAQIEAFMNGPKP